METQYGPVQIVDAVIHGSNILNQVYTNRPDMCHALASKSLIKIKHMTVLVSSNISGILQLAPPQSVRERYCATSECTGWAQKTGPFFEVHNFLYNDLGRQSIYQNVQLFIRSRPKNDILNTAVFKYSLH